MWQTQDFLSSEIEEKDGHAHILLGSSKKKDVGQTHSCFSSKIKLLMHLHSSSSSDNIEYNGHRIQISVLVLQLKQLGWQSGIIKQTKGVSVKAKWLSLQIHDYSSSDKVELVGH